MSLQILRHSSVSLVASSLKGLHLHCGHADRGGGGAGGEEQVGRPGRLKPADFEKKT
jgi:hypothetical protein